MKTSYITETECLDGGVLVTFGNEITALFTAAFLFEHLREAVELCDIRPLKDRPRTFVLSR